VETSLYVAAYAQRDTGMIESMGLPVTPQRWDLMSDKELATAGRELTRRVDLSPNSEGTHRANLRGFRRRVEAARQVRRGVGVCRRGARGDRKGATPTPDPARGL